MICIYHNKDLDGLCSAAIVRRAFPECELFGWDHGDPIPDLSGQDEIIMVDISFPLTKMLELATVYGSRLTVIDHHKSFIDKFIPAIEHIKDPPICNLQVGLGACELTYEYFFDLEIPEWIALLGKFDTWREFDTWEWKNRILPFQYAMRARVQTPMDLFEIDKSIKTIIEEGISILRYVKTNESFLMSKYAFTCEFEGLTALCLNMPNTNLLTFKSIYDNTKHDLVLAFNYTGSFWKISIATDNESLDCSAIASKYGGGGHAQAAGFEVKDINKLIKKINGEKTT